MRSWNMEVFRSEVILSYLIPSYPYTKTLTLVLSARLSYLIPQISPKANGAARKPLGVLLHVLSHRHFPRLRAVINTQHAVKLHLCSPVAELSLLSIRLRAFPQLQRWLQPRATWQRTSTSSRPPPLSPRLSKSRTAVFPPLRYVFAVFREDQWTRIQCTAN